MTLSPRARALLIAQVLKNLARDCEQLGEGEALVAPVGWAGPDLKGVLLLVVVARGGAGGWAGADGSACSVAVINAKCDVDGRLFHACKLDATTGQFLRRRALVLAAVSRGAANRAVAGARGTSGRARDERSSEAARGRIGASEAARGRIGASEGALVAAKPRLRAGIDAERPRGRWSRRRRGCPPGIDAERPRGPLVAATPAGIYSAEVPVSAQVPRHRVAHAACWFVLLRPLLGFHAPGARCGAPPAVPLSAADASAFDRARHFYGECLPVLDDDDQRRDCAALATFDDVARPGGFGRAVLEAAAHVAPGGHRAPLALRRPSRRTVPVVRRCRIQQKTVRPRDRGLVRPAGTSRAAGPAATRTRSRAASRFAQRVSTCWRIS